jgi:hypothetical protein
VDKPGLYVLFEQIRIKVAFYGDYAQIAELVRDVVGIGGEQQLVAIPRGNQESQGFGCVMDY